jgi:hypothetical protein
MGFQHICITAAPYNELEYPWQIIKAHVTGAGNTSDNRYWRCREHMTRSSLLLTWKKLYWMRYKVLIYLMSLNIPSGTS